MRWHTDGREHFLYRVYDGAKRLLYVGLTVNPYSRFSHHKTAGLGGVGPYPAKKWYPLMDHVEWEDVGRVRSLAEGREMEVIQQERPLFNRQLRSATSEATA